MANHAKLNGSGDWVYMGAMSPGWMCNLGLEAAQTTVAADSIKITGADGSDLSTSFPLKLTLPHTTSGILTTFEVSANVTINLTGAHWGLGTLGDFSDVQLRVYAINDTGAIKWGVSLQGGLRTVADTATSTTATNINLRSEMLVNTALNAGTWPCQQVAWFNANFDDAGGSSEDLWVVQTGVGDLNVGIPVPDQTDFVTYTPTGGFNNTTYSGRWKRSGNVMTVRVFGVLTNTPGVALLSANLPSGYLIDTTQITDADLDALGIAYALDSGTSNESGTVIYNNSSSVRIVDDGVGSAWSEVAPMTWAVNDEFHLTFSVPIVQWSSNGSA